MSLKAILYAYILGGLTFFPLVIALCIAWTIYTSVPVGDPDIEKPAKSKLWKENAEHEDEEAKEQEAGVTSGSGLGVALDLPKTRKAWLTVRRTFEEKETDGSYVNLMRSFLDSRSKDPKRSRPQDMWYVVLKMDVLYLYEDESMTECEAAIHLHAHEVTVFPEGLLDGELFTKRNAIYLKPRPKPDQAPHSVTKEMQLKTVDPDAVQEAKEKNSKKELGKLAEAEKKAESARQQALDPSTPWFIFIRSCTEMENWYHSLVHASSNPPNTSTLEPLKPVYRTEDMDHLISTLDEQPDVIPMRWFNAIIGRVFFSFYRSQTLESIIIGRLMKKLSKVKTPSFLQNIVVTEVSVGQNIPMFSKPMLKDLTKEGDAVVDVHISFRGELRITVEATASLSLSQHLKSYSVKLVLAVVLRELDGNLLLKLKRPPTNRLWYAFTQPPTMRLDVEPIVSDRQIKWTMILSTIESRLKEIINESVVMPNMDDIAFFDSSSYEHRGGIYANATRKAFKDNATNEGAESEASSSQEPVKSHSTDELLTGPLSSPAPEALNMTRAETVAFPGDTGTLSKRKTWFSNGPKDAVDSSDVRLESGTTLQTPERGRPTALQADEDPSSSSSSSGKRATSVPAEIIVSEPEPTTAEQTTQRTNTFLNTQVPDTAPLMGDSLSEQQSRSLFSRHRTMSSSTSASIGDDRSSTGSSSGAASLLATIKAKAGDKQALSNSAKEAMRKWSANWNGFKREHLNKNSNNTGARDSQIAGDALDEPDFLTWSEPGSRPRGASDADGRDTLNRRGSWKSTNSTSGSSTETRSTPIAIPVSGSDKPQTDSHHGGTESSSPSASASGGASTSGSLSKASAPGSSSSPGRPSMLKRYSGVLSTSAPPAPAVTTDVHIGTTSPSLAPIQGSKPVSSSSPYIEPPAASPHLPPTSAFSPSLPASPNPAPIHKQPSQGASMMIPGIHASHRGEVMSMGYAPPPPTPPSHVATSPSLLGSDNGSKSSTSTTIQGMYKLFMAQRSPSASSQVPAEPSPSVSPARLPDDSGSATTITSDGVDANSDVQKFSLPPPGNPYTIDSIPLELPPKPDLPPRRKPTITTTPPPLPPRTLPNNSASSNEPEADVGYAGAAMGNAHLIAPNPISSPASEALKVIVSQDEQQRRQSLDLDADYTKGQTSAPVSASGTGTAVSNNLRSKRDSGNPRSALGARRVSRSLFPEFADEDPSQFHEPSGSSTSGAESAEYNAANGSAVQSGKRSITPDGSPRNGLVTTHDLAATKPPLPPRKTPVSIAAQST